MAIVQQHSIRNLMVEFDLNTNRINASDLNSLSTFTENHLLPVLGKKFDKYCTDTNLIILDKLELNMDVELEGSWEEALLGAFERSLEEELRSLDVTDQKRETARSSASMEALYEYLDTGRLPWFYTVEDFSSFELECIHQMTERSSRDLIDFIIDRPLRLQRIVQAFSDEFFIALVKFQQIPEKDLPGHHKIQSAIREILGIKLSQKQSRQQYTEALLISLRSNPTGSVQFQNTLIEILLRKNFKFKVSNPARYSADKSIKKELPQLIPSEHFSKLVQDILSYLKTGKRNRSVSPAIQVIGANRDIDPKKEDKTIIRPADSVKGENDQNTASDRHGERASPGESGMEKRSQESYKEGIYVPYAGIVLLHPFLPPLFENLGLTENGRWTSLGQVQKAVHLLAYLATGQTYCPEYDMGLFKLLCGEPTDLLVDSQLSLSSSEMEEADDVLSAALDHWRALKTDSHDALRTAFIHRDGKFSHGDDSCEIIVEQKAQDVLLNSLPWGLSMIKLPWLTQLIRIVWT